MNIDADTVYQIVFTCDGSRSFTSLVFVGTEASEFVYGYNRGNHSAVKAEAVPLAKLAKAS